MDGYFVTPPPVQTFHAPYTPEATPWGNAYRASLSVINRFWSVRDLWLEEYWTSQSESACAAVSARVQPPAFTPYVSMTPVVMLSW